MKKKFGKGFKNALLIAAMLSVGAGFGYAATNITDDDVTAAGGRYQTPSNGDYNVTTAITGHTTPGTSDKGVIYHAKTGTVYVLKNSNFSNNWAQQGGAIYTTGSGKNVVITDANFTGNHTSQHGGALYTKGDLTINASTQDVTFSGNYVESSSYTGGAIYAERALNINATGGDIIFENNYIKTSSNKNDIFLKSSTDTKMNVNTAGGHFVKFAGGITSSGNGATINKTGLGTMELAAPSTFQGTVNIQQGILKTTNGGGGTNTLFTNAKKTTFSDGTTISSINNAIDSTNLGNLTMDGNVNLAFDVNTTAGNTDTFTAGTITRNSDTYKFKLSAGNMNNIDSSAELSSFTKQIATGDLIALIDTVVSGKDIAGSSKSWGLGYNATTGVLTFTAEESLDIKTAINDNTHTSYTLNANETVSGNIGAMGNKSTMLIESSAGNKFTVDGNSKAGMEIGSGKSMTIKDVAFDRFEKDGDGGVIHNQGTLTLNNVDFTGNTATSYGGAIYNNGTITKISDATFGSATDNTKGNTANYGGAIGNKYGTIKSLSADFYYNKATYYGGAIYNGGTIGDTTDLTKTAISGTFIGNSATQYGGAIYNWGTITKISDATFGSATDNTKGNTARYGGAIDNESTINSLSADFYYNKATYGGGAIYNWGTIGDTTDLTKTAISGNFIGNSATQYGGAIYNDGTIGTLTGNFIGNTAENGNGGAIYNRGTLTIKTSDTADITFSGNTDSTGSNAIHNARGTVTFDGTKNIILNDSLTSDYTSDTNQGKYVKQGTGALVLNNSMSGVSGDVEIKGGTVKIDSTEGGTFFTNAHNTTFDGTDLTLDTQDGTVNATALGTLTMNSDVAMKIDVDTNAGEGDTFSATAVSGTGEFVLSAGNMKNVGTGTEASFSYEIADSVLRSHINETVSGSEIESSAHAWAIGYSKSSGVLTFTMGSLLDIKTAINDDTHTSYTLNANETVSGNIGAMGNKSTMLIESSAGNKFTVNGNSKAGMEIGSYSGNPQSMTINNATFTNFTKSGNGGVIHNQGTLTLNNVDFTGNTATSYGGAIYNDGGTITKISDATFGSATDNTKGNTAQYGGAIYNNDGTIKSISADFYYNKATYEGGAIYNYGTITKISDATFGSATDNTKGNTAQYGGAIYNESTINSLSADFYYNKTTNGGGAIYNGGTIGDTTDLTKTAISGTFIGNSATKYGGAIRNDGTITKISDATFGSATDNTKGNTAQYGGAIYNESTINSLSADFYYNKATYDGGAIYNWGTIGDTTDLTKTAISGNFIGNSATRYGGAIYNDGGTITKIADATFGSATDNTKGNTANWGGAIYNNDGTIKSLSADFYYNKATYGGGAIHNDGTIGTLTGNFTGNTAENGGAIYNNGAINSISADFYYNKTTNGDGGAIANLGLIDSVKGNFTGNYAVGISTGSGIGGAIANGSTMTVVDPDFTGNMASALGGAILNVQLDPSLPANLTISALTKDVTFSGNKQGVTFDSEFNPSGGTSNAIYNTAGGIVTFNAAEGKNIVLNDSLADGDPFGTGFATPQWNKTGEGTLVLKSDNSAVYGDVQIQGGTVQLTNNGAVKGTLFSNASKTTWSDGTTIDAQNGYKDTISLGQSAEISGSVNAKIDVDLTGTDTTNADYFTAGSAVTGGGKIVLNTVVSDVLTNIAETSTVIPPIDGSTLIRKIADDNVKNSIQLGSDISFKGKLQNGDDHKWLVTYSRDTGNLTFANGWSLKEAINYKDGAYQSDIDVVFNASENETTGTIGNLGGNKTTVNMNNYTIDGNGGSGIVVQNANQELVINNANVIGFKNTSSTGAVFIDNTKGATLSLNNSTFDNKTAGDTIIDNKTNYIVTKGDTTITNSTFSNHRITSGSKNGSVIFADGDMTLRIEDSTFDGNQITSTSNTSGGAIYANNSSTAIELLNTSFTNNSFNKGSGSNGGGAIYAKGSVSVDADTTGVVFSGNTAKGSGGAIYHNSGSDSKKLSINSTGTETITFSNNTATCSSTGESYGGGAIYSNRNLTVNNALFNSNSTNSYGGAISIYNGAIITNTSFTSNTATGNGGAIFNKQKDLNLDATVTGMNLTSNQGADGGALYQGNTNNVNINKNGGNKNIAFSGNTATGSGGAIYSKGAINAQNADFTNNTATTNGGAVYVTNGATLDGLTFSGNKTTSGNGGAVYTNNSSTYNINNTNFTSNTAAANGGAIYNNNGTVNIDATTQQVTFSGNTATSGNGGAIYNKKTLNLNATNYDIVFSSNTDSTGSNDIYNAGTMTIDTAAGKKVSFTGGISSDDSTSRIVNKNGAGTLLINGADMSNFKGKVNLNGGTVKIENSGKFFSGANLVDVKSADVLLDVKNGAANDQIDLGNLKLTNDLNIAVDVDLLNGDIDNFTSTGTISGDKNIIIETVAANMKAINDLPASVYPQTTSEGTEYSSRRVVTQIADTTIADKFKLADRISLDVREDITGSTNNHPDTGWFMYYNSTTGELNFIDQSLRTTLKDTADTVKKYIMAANETVESHLDDIVGTSVQIIGTKQGSDPNDYAIYGDGNRGAVVASGQILTVEDVSEVSGFANSFMDVRSGANGAVDNVTFKNAVTDTTVNGAAILNAGTTTVKDSTFDGNTAGNGGAVYNTGTISIEGSTFTNNGAIATEGKGGAIYNKGETSIVNLKDITIDAPTGTNQNDVYNEGTINVTDGTNTFASAVTNGGTMNIQGGTNTFSGDITTTGTMNFGGTNTISGAITATATGDNKINFTGTNTLTSTIAMTGDMALTNSGALELNSDLSAYTGNFIQTTGSTNVKSTATLFGGTNTVEGGTMALDGVLASNLDIQGGTVTSTTGTFAGTSATTVNGGTLQMDGGSVKGGATVDVYSGNMNFDGGNLENGSNTNVVGGTMTMNGGTMDDGSTVTVNSGTMNYQSGTVDGTLAVNDGNMNIQGDLTIKNNSYIYQDAKLTIDSGKTLTVENLDSGNSVGVQLNNGDNWNGTVNVGANGILSVTDLVQSGNLIQTAGTSTFTNSVINMALSDVTGGNVNMFGSKLNYASGKTFAPDNLNLANQSTINMMNANPNDTLSLKNVSTTGTNNLTVDINPMAHKIDKVVINGDLNGVGAIKISDWNFMGKMPLDKNYKFKVVDVNGAINNVDFLATNKQYNTPIGTYQLKSNGGGTYTFGLTQYNPDIFRGQVATMAAYQNQVIIDNIILDQFVLHNHLYDKNDKQANRYASAQSLFAPYQHSKEEGGLWFRSYVDFETLTFKNNLSANNNSYGALVGADLPVVKLKHNWDFIPTFYVGYTGSSQSLNHNHMYQNGGQGGFMGTFIHNDFIGSVMAYGGGYNNEMHVGDETDHTGNWFAGTAAKAAYNLHATKHFIIQPTAFISYNIFGRQNWHTDLGSFGMNSGLLNGINVAPGLNLIYQRETWSAYATFQYMYNINDQVSGHAGNINLPALKMRHGYFQYGIGATKTWKDRLSSYFQFVIRNGGRTGIGFQLGAKYSFDWNLKPKSKSNLKSGSTQTQKTAGERTVIKSVK